MAHACESCKHACRYLYVFGVQVSRFAISFSTGTVAFAFIFGNSLREVYESLVWLFGVNPYDAGLFSYCTVFVGSLSGNCLVNWIHFQVCRYPADDSSIVLYLEPIQYF